MSSGPSPPSDKEDKEGGWADGVGKGEGGRWNWAKVGDLHYIMTSCCFRQWRHQLFFVAVFC